jgi:hypothetical protein
MLDGVSKFTPLSTPLAAANFGSTSGGGVAVLKGLTKTVIVCVTAKAFSAVGEGDNDAKADEEKERDSVEEVDKDSE